MKELIYERTMEEIGGLQASLALLELLPNDLPHAYGGYVTSNSGGNVCLRLPADVTKLRDFRRALGPGWHCVKVHQHDDGQISRAYWHKDSIGELLIWVTPNAEGATCQRVQVGEKTVPIYEVVCN